MVLTRPLVAALTRDRARATHDQKDRLLELLEAGRVAMDALPRANRSSYFAEWRVLVNGGRAHWQHPDRTMRDDSTRADAGTNPGSLAHELP